MIPLLTTVLVCSAALGALTFIVRYLWTTWFDSAMGWHSMVFMLVILLLTSLAVVREVFGADWTGRETVRLISYLLINGVIWWRVWLLFSAQHRGRRRARMMDKEAQR